MGGAPTKAGRYQIVGELGRGSMGVVYQGFDPVIGRTVAIKTMLTQSLPPQEFQEYKARFQREAQAAGALTHPNIVTVYDFGEDSGLFYLAMEYLEGKSLEKFVEEQNILPLETIIPVYEQVCGALDHAHSHKIVHRDIKPANIMLLKSGLVKVTDFGIAKMMSMGMTQAGQILGTPNYMSPEQVKGRAVDGRSDIFSLGVILYELITGEKPFGGQNITTVIYKIINENPIPPRELDATIHPGLNYVVSKALAKSADERYQNCRAFAEDLKNYRNLNGLTPPTETVVLRVPPPIQTVQPDAASLVGDQSIVPPEPAAAGDTTSPVEEPIVRSLSVHVIPPAGTRREPTSPLLWVALTIVVLGLLGAGGYYFLARQRARANITQNAPQPVSQPPQPAETAAQPAAPTTQPAAQPGESPSQAGGQPSAPEQPASQPIETTPATTQPAAGGLTTPAPEPKSQPEPAKPEPAKPAETAHVAPPLAPAKTMKAPAAPKLGTLIVTSNPPGASIKVDDRSDPTWVTPHTFADFPAGTHMVALSRDGYANFAQSITIESGQTSTLNPTLSVPGGEMTIVTVPAGIEVLIDGKSYGPSPVSAMLPVGKHAFRIMRPGTDPYDSSFEIKFDGYIATKRVDLGGGVSTGVVLVRTTPPGASVTADGKPLEGKTPVNIRLSAGPHKLAVSLDGYAPVVQDIEIKPEGTPEVDLKLSPQ